MNPCILLTAVVFVAFSASACYADGPDSRVNYFSSLYASLCMKNVNDVAALRISLMDKGLSKFPPEQAALFLSGNDGDAWPVPFEGKMGNFVVGLLTGKNLCAVYARRAPPTEVERQFIQLVGTAPAPLISEVKQNTTAETGSNGKTHTISYTWSLPKASQKLLFTLTTSSREDALIQAMASAATISE